MSPRAHVPHHRHPTEPLAEERAGRIIVWYGLHCVWKEFDFQTLLRDQTANQKIIGGVGGWRSGKHTARIQSQSKNGFPPLALKKKINVTTTKCIALMSRN